MTKTGAIYLHTPCPDWCKMDDGLLCDEIMLDILTGGNFGRKNLARSRSAIMVSNHGKDGTRHGKLYFLWNALLNIVWTKHPIVSKYPILYVFCTPMCVLQHIHRVITRKRVLTIGKTVRYANERKSLYDRLHLFDTVKRWRSKSSPSPYKHQPLCGLKAVESVMGRIVFQIESTRYEASPFHNYEKRRIDCLVILSVSDSTAPLLNVVPLFKAEKKTSIPGGYMDYHYRLFSEEEKNALLLAGFHITLMALMNNRRWL